jgi:ArsR family transcriptional regulator, arsenate/arsenite/antimonite-responsive transcriptional repressor
MKVLFMRTAQGVICKMDDWRELKTMLKALGDMARLTIVYHLAHHEEVTVTDLTDLLGISQPLVSWHLRRLRRAGLIRTRRTGRQVFCSLDMERFQQCVQSLELLIDPTTFLDSLPAGEALMEAEASLED